MGAPLQSQKIGRPVEKPDGQNGQALKRVLSEMKITHSFSRIIHFANFVRKRR
jgi:hypothetical protein